MAWYKKNTDTYDVIISITVNAPFDVTSYRHPYSLTRMCVTKPKWVNGRHDTCKEHICFAYRLTCVSISFPMQAFVQDPG